MNCIDVGMITATFFNYSKHINISIFSKIRFAHVNMGTTLAEEIEAMDDDMASQMD